MAQWLVMLMLCSCGLVDGVVGVGPESDGIADTGEVVGRDEAPTCVVLAPANGSTWDSGAPVRFHARVADDVTPADQLQFRWQVDHRATVLAGAPDSHGEIVDTVSVLTVGNHELTLTVTDAGGEHDRCVTAVTVRDCRDADGDGVSPCDGDCDDADDSVFAGAVELADAIDNDCDGVVDEDTDWGDDDGDGFTEDGGDCDDTDPAVHPDAVEVFYDDVDQDCRGDSDFDADGDGADSDAFGGDDCDDADPAIGPAAAEARDGRDNDCDGVCDEGLLSTGDLVITEVMKQPVSASESDGEWFEVYNATSIGISLCDGWQGMDDQFDAFTVVGPVSIAAGGLATFVRHADPARNGGITPDYTFGRSLQLGNDSDQVVLWFEDPDLGGFEMSRVDYGDGPLWPDTAGSSVSLDPAWWNETDNDDPAHWCHGTTTFGAGDIGTPGAMNDGC